MMKNQIWENLRIGLRALISTPDSEEEKEENKLIARNCFLSCSTLTQICNEQGLFSSGAISKGERYLCLLSTRSLYCVDLKTSFEKHGERCRKYLRNDPDPPSALVISHILLPFHFPIGMRHFEFPPRSSNIYLLGGEFLSDSKSTFQPSLLSPCAYKLLVHNESVSDMSLVNNYDDQHIPSMIAGKCLPIVEHIEGKIYALHSRFVRHGRPNFPSPAFEVFDPVKGCWDPLPNPFFFKNFQQRLPPITYEICSHVVIGYRLFVVTSEGKTACFDARLGRWLNDFSCNVVLPSLCGFTNLYKSGLYVGITVKFDHPLAYLVTAEGCTLALQPLDMFNDFFPLGFCSFSHVVPLPDKDTPKNRMCAVFVAAERRALKCNNLLIVIFFSLHPLPDKESEICDLCDKSLSCPKDFEPEFSKFVHVQVEDKYSWTIPNPRDSSDHFLKDAFFLKP